jgi:glutathione S-transferase
MAKLARLITIPFSHYCEKARWALDWTRLPYQEDKYLPMAHKLATRGGTVPVLVTRHGRLADSAKILAFADAHAEVERRLYPRDAAPRAEVDALERVFNDELAPATRLFGYHHGLPRANALAELVAPGLTPVQRRLFPVLTPFVAPKIRARYAIDDGTATRARETILRVFADLSARLAGRKYLVGDRFTAADLTFASLAAPSLMPEGHPMWKSDLGALPEPLRAHIEELRATRAGEHGLRMYREHRRS